MLTQPDASGGLGSIPGALWNTVAMGLPMIAAGELSKRYGFSFGADGQVTVNANEGVKPAATPGSAVGIGEQAAAALANPFVIAGGIAAIVVVALLITRR